MYKVEISFVLRALEKLQKKSITNFTIPLIYTQLQLPARFSPILFSTSYLQIFLNIDW